MIVLDSHVLVWWVSGARRLSTRASRAIRSALKSGPVSASTISILEIATAVRLGRLVLAGPIDPWLDDLRSLPEIRFEPVTVDIARKAGSLGDQVPGDPADRVILATASVLGAKLVTADERLAKAPGVQTLW